MLYQDRIAQLGWPEYKSQSQRQYISKLLISGFSVNSKQCHYIGINHLHSILPKLKKKGFPHTVDHKKVIDPATGKLSPTNVDSVYMTQEQKQEWQERQNGEIQTLTNSIKKPKPRP